MKQQYLQVTTNNHMLAQTGTEVPFPSKKKTKNVCCDIGD